MPLDPAAVAKANQDFHSNHPERNGAPITAEEAESHPELVDEWKAAYFAYLENNGDDDTGPGLTNPADPPGAEPASQQVGQCVVPCPLSNQPPVQPSTVATDKPCDFQQVIIKCHHCPDNKPSKPKRVITGVKYWLQPPDVLNDLRQPKPGSDRVFTSEFQVVAFEDDAGADTMSIAISGGPGYQCGQQHPHIRVHDLMASNWTVKKGEVTHDFKVKCRELAPVPLFMVKTPIDLILYYFFPTHLATNYDVLIDACGHRTGQPASFAHLQQRIHVEPADTYKLSLNFPSYRKKTYNRTAGKFTKLVTDPSSTSNETVKGWTAESEKTTTKTSDTKYEESFSISGSGGQLTEKRSLAINKDGTAQYDEICEHDKNPISSPVESLAASFSLQRNGKDTEASAALGQIAKTIVNVQDTIQSVMNFIKEFQPQVGWKFTFEMEFLKGMLTYEWGMKECQDHAVFRWWRFNVGMTLFSCRGEISFGASAYGITAVVFGALEMKDVTLKLEKENNDPDAAEPWEVVLEGVPGGELGVKAVLGDEWLHAEGKFVMGFPFEGRCVCSTSQPFKIDYKIDFTGVTVELLGHSKFLGTVKKTWTPVDPRPEIAKGSIFGPDDPQSGLQKP